MSRIYQAPKAASQPPAPVKSTQSPIVTQTAAPKPPVAGIDLFRLFIFT